MSYILDALKKAQAERQIGALPTIHAPVIARQASARSNKPVWLALGGMALLALLLLARQPWPGPSPSSTPSAQLVKPLAAAPATIPAPPPMAVASNVMASGLPRAAPAPMARKAAPPVLAPPQPAARAADEILVSVHELPEQLQREIAPLQIKGYIYSKDPAERLLLTDKALRHEGEEVAPGLILEQLQAKSAVFSYKGYRYRVPY